MSNLKVLKMLFLFFTFMAPIDLSARAIIVNASSSEGLVQTIRYLRLGLTPRDRHALTVSPAAIKNQAALKVDLEHQSDSKNFQLLRRIYLSRDFRVVLQLAQPDAKVPFFVAVVDHDKWRMREYEEIYGQPFYVSAATGVLGWNLVALSGKLTPDVVYSGQDADYVFVAADQSRTEIIATIFHELTHALFAQGGLSPLAQNHGLPDVDHAITEASTEARANARLKDF